MRNEQNYTEFELLPEFEMAGVDEFELLPEFESVAQALSSGTDWTTILPDQRMLYVVERLVNRYSFPVNGASGLVGNLMAESALLPNRVEGSATTTPMRARNFQNQWQNFTAAEIMNRNFATKRGPKSPGIGLAQWTYVTRRSGLFQHSYMNQVPGANILFDMDAQIDYLVSELQTSFRGVNRILRSAAVTVDNASDEVLYNFERPASILDQNKNALPRNHPQVQNKFKQRRPLAQKAFRIYSAAHP